jgi:hypothetical protein
MLQFIRFYLPIPALFTYSSYAFCVQQGYNIVKDNILCLWKALPIVIFLVGLLFCITISDLKMETVCFSEMLVSTYKSTSHHN